MSEDNIIHLPSIHKCRFDGHHENKLDNTQDDLRVLQIKVEALANAVSEGFAETSKCLANIRKEQLELSDKMDQVIDMLQYGRK